MNTGRRIPLLRDVLEPRTMSGRLKRMHAEVKALQLAGPLSDGLQEASAAAIAAAAAAATPTYSVFDEFTAAEQILRSTGVGIGTVLDVPAQSVLARAAGSIDALPIAAQELLGRTASSDLGPVTPLQIINMLPFTRKTANYTATTSDFGIGFAIAASRILTLPATPPNWTKLLVFDALGTFAVGNTLTINPSGGDTIDGGPSHLLSIAGSLRWLIYSSTDNNWEAG